MTKASDLLLEVGAQRSARRRVERRYEERLAPSFTPFQFLDAGENGLSRVLAWLLDPRGSHAQGDRFLSSFLEWAEVDWPAPAVAAAQVRTEAPFSTGSRTRRIDVLVTAGRRAVAIENKLDAVDQPEQVSDYLDHISAVYAVDAPLIYLTQEDERLPSGESIAPGLRARAERSGRLRCRSYAQLEVWLRTCRSACAAPAVCGFIDGMLLHVRRNMLGVEDMEEAVQLADEICGSRAKLEAAFEIFQAQALVERRLSEHFIGVMERKVEEREGWTLSHDNMANAERDGWLLIQFASDARFAVGIGFDRPRFREFFYGLRHVHPSKNHRRRAPDELLDALEAVLGSTKASQTWPAWKTPGANDPFFGFGRHPGGRPEFWLELHGEAFADRVIGFAEELQGHLRAGRRLPSLSRYRGE